MKHVTREQILQNSQAKPFVKWVGGKGQLLEKIEAAFPADRLNNSKTVYVEPFVGGGAMLFHVLTRYPHIQKAIINDINNDLTRAYTVVRDHVDALIEKLNKLQDHYYSIPEVQRKDYYLQKRHVYNEKKLDAIENTALFIFLNRTCFNGLHRVNGSGAFNVPFGKYANPKICDEATLRADSAVLQKVEILSGDFAVTADYATPDSIFYIDPPYKPLSNTSSFNSYAKEKFNDAEQIRLKQFCDTIAGKKATWVLSNSDVRSNAPDNRFFDDLYKDYNIDRVWAVRMVNANPEKRGKLTELLINNVLA